VLSRYVVRGVGVGVVREERRSSKEEKNEKTSLRFNQIGGLDKLSKMNVIG
jgi:hypothetical protein